MLSKLVASLFVATGLAATACGQPELRRYEFESPHMGTLFQIVLYANDPATARASADAAFGLVQKLDRSFSDYDADSELMRLVEKREGIVSRELFDVLSRAQDIAAETGGAFDITNGAHTRNWRRARITGQLPSPAAIDKAMAATGWRKLELDPSSRKVTLTVPGMFLDLGGIAKGYAADAVLKLLKARGHTRASVAAGGDIAAGSPPPGKSAWTVGIAPDGKAASRTVELAHQAISTSGDAEQKITIGGTSYSHIVDARTGLGLIDSTPVSVIARTATRSDALATALSVMGRQDAKAFAEEHDLQVYWGRPKRPESLDDVP